MKKLGKKKSGFSLIELLVVLSIIGVLFTVVLDSLNRGRMQAQASRMAQDFHNMRTAFLLLADDEARTTWWTEAEIGGSNGDKPVSLLSADTARYGKYMPTAPTPPTGGDYKYNRNGSTTFVCGAFNGNGVQLYAQGVPDGVIAALDAQVDKGDGDGCGKIIWYGSDVRYMLGYSSGDMF